MSHYSMLLKMAMWIVFPARDTPQSTTNVVFPMKFKVVFFLPNLFWKINWSEIFFFKIVYLFIIYNVMTFNIKNLCYFFFMDLKYIKKYKNITFKGDINFKIVIYIEFKRTIQCLYVLNRYAYMTVKVINNYRYL